MKVVGEESRYAASRPVSLCQPAVGPLRLFAFCVLLFFTACHRTPTVDQPSALPKLSEQIRLCRDGQSKGIVVRGETVNDRQFAQIVQSQGVEVLELYQCQLTSLQGIEQLEGLRRLRLENFACDDAAAMRLSKLPQLISVNLPQATFTDQGLGAMAALPQLQQLRFGSPHVSDRGMAAVAASPTLRFLHLIQVPITDSGLRAFHDMKQLESFYLDGGSATDAGIRQLLTALPELHFHRDQLHLPNDPRADGH